MLTYCAEVYKTDCSLVGQEILSFYWIRRVITVVTRCRNLSLSWATWILSTQSHLNPQSSVLILSFHLRPLLPRVFISSSSPVKTPDAFFLFLPTDTGCLAIIMFLDRIILTVHGRVKITELLFRWSCSVIYFVFSSGAIPCTPSMYSDASANEWLW